MKTDQEISARKQVQVRAKGYVDAYLARDIAALGQILADDWILTTAGCGDQVTKQGQLEDLKSGKLKIYSIEDNDVSVRVFGETAIVSGARRSKVTYSGRDVSDHARFSQVYVDRLGQWQCVATQITSLVSSTERLLVATSRAYAQAYLKGDTAALRRILADDWTLITPGCGDRIDKRRHLEDVERGVLKVEQIEDSAVHVRIYGEAALVSGLRRSQATYNGRDISDETRFTQVYSASSGTWQCVSTQVTAIRPDPDRMPAS